MTKISGNAANKRLKELGFSVSAIKGGFPSKKTIDGQRYDNLHNATTRGAAMKLARRYRGQKIDGSKRFSKVKIVEIQRETNGQMKPHWQVFGLEQTAYYSGANLTDKYPERY